MLVYRCKHCGCFIIEGFQNEFNEHFCSERCYKLYCGIHGYDVNLQKLKEIKFP